MIKNIATVAFVLVFAVCAFAADSPTIQSIINQHERRTVDSYKGLENYSCDVITSNFDVVMQRMTENFPKDMPRPQRPELRKYWDVKTGMTVKAEGKNAFPYMQDFAKRMSSQFALELHGYFFPVYTAKKRNDLLKTAKIEILQDNGAKKIKLTFSKKTDIDHAFFGKGLPVPTKNVTAVEIRLLGEDQLLRTMTIQYEGEKYKDCVIEAGYEKIDQRNYLTSLLIATEDQTSLLAEFATKFAKIDGFYLPVSQKRRVEGMIGTNEFPKVEVEFKNYKINDRQPSKKTKK